jgi:hypothetical protein
VASGLSRVTVAHTRLRRVTDTGVVTYDLIVLPVDRALTYEEASAEVERVRRSRGLGFGHDKRLDPFIAAMGKRYWQLRARTPIPAPFEFDVARGHVFVGIPRSKVEEVVTAVGESAYGAGVAVWDPQRAIVGLPAPFAEAPMSAEGTQAHVSQATDAMSAIRGGAMATPIDDPEGLVGNAAEDVHAATFRQASPLGFEITPEIADEVAADPTRMPGSLQTTERRDELLAELAVPRAPDRHLAIVQLAGWDPDPLVASALRPLVASDDVFESSQAASGLARQSDVTDLPAVMDLLYRLSPADGASQATMVIPLRAALALAALASPAIVDGVRVRAREWRAAGSGPRPAWDHEMDADLDALLAEG